jgi:hypothetical protein
MRHNWTSAALALALLGNVPVVDAQQVTVDRTAIGTVERPVRVVGRGGGARVPPAAAARISIARDELLVARTGNEARETVINDRARFELPVRIIGVASSGEQLNLGAVVEVARGGLRLRNDATAFVGQIFVGIEDKDNPTGARPLGRRVQFLVTADADSVKPEGLDLDHVNLPYVPVQIEVTRPGDVVGVHVRPDFEPQGFDLKLPVARPRLTLVPSLSSLQGLGLETTDVVVGVADASVPAGLVVALSAQNRGKLTPAEVTLGADGTATAGLRSNGLGTADIVARHPLFSPAKATVTFVFPWPFAMAVLLGGTLGGMLRYAWLKVSKSERIKIVPLVWHAVLGIAAGLLVATAYAVGINLLDVQPAATTGEALVFSLAAIGALATGRVVKAISA